MRLLVSHLCSLYAISRRTALRWSCDAMSTVQETRAKVVERVAGLSFTLPNYTFASHFAMIIDQPFVVPISHCNALRL